MPIVRLLLAIVLLSSCSPKMSTSHIQKPASSESLFKELELEYGISNEDEFYEYNVEGIDVLISFPFRKNASECRAILIHCIYPSGHSQLIVNMKTVQPKVKHVWSEKDNRVVFSSITGSALLVVPFQAFSDKVIGW